ncbi:sialate O-acetylesterase [Dyadobacter psychrotolerans]|uniref:T9SS type A sorting domain-containing protein n=1 Tax=Dyadobacter psychrotolerans TaxID=2541721 RepID=A0A4R5E136_9BACT|nr:sialate O-acetylesterase [Dyadobacter psychrotolerans]TDE18331.1 T9SS type A sorting domain-containing protein [Dyadobacter psychrotolerans]
MKFLHQHTLKVSLLFCLLFTFSPSQAERILSIVFDKLPKDRQLYARDDQNDAIVPVSGIIEVTGFSHMSMVVYKQGERFNYSKATLQYNGNSKTSFAMTAKIKAELAEYTVEVYACRSATDSLLMTTRTAILAGDFYVINGQSNAAAATRYNVTAPQYVNQFSRTLARTPDNSPAYTAADTIWKTPEWVTPEEGYWGRELQRHIIETYKIPVCILNGAIPGSRIADHLIRNVNNPSDPGSIYGHLLHRTKISQATRIRAFFWYQGEEDAWNNPGIYPASFDKLMKYWEADYPMVDKFVIVQINILDGAFYEAGALREFQRQTKYKYPKTDHFAVLGLAPMLDGVHYSDEGYFNFGKQIFDYLGPKDYKATITQNVDSPDIQKVFYSDDKKSITMVFDQNQTLKWQGDTTVNGVTTRLQDQFFLDGNETKPATVLSWDVTGNRVILNLAAAVNATKLNYLPSYKKGYYQGPYIKNIRGLGAFSFHEFTISPALANNMLTSTLSAVNTVQLSWQKSTEATSYILEKKSPGQAGYSAFKIFDNTVSAFEDADVAVNSSYSYRMKSYSALSESPLSETTIKTMPLLATEPVTSGMVWKVFPNPTPDYVEIEFADVVSGNIELLSVNGNKLGSVDVMSSKTAHMTLTNSSAGIYFLTFRQKNGHITTKRIVKY